MLDNSPTFYRFAFDYIKKKLTKFQLEKPLEFDVFKEKYFINFYTVDTSKNIMPGGMYDNPQKMLDHIAFQYGNIREINKSHVVIALIQNLLTKELYITMHINYTKFRLISESNRKRRYIFHNQNFRPLEIRENLLNKEEHINHILKMMFNFNSIKNQKIFI